MKIGIIGAGQIGSSLAYRLTALGHQVVIANSRGPDTLAEVVQETGARAVTVSEAVRHGEVVIVTIPQKSVLQLPEGLFRGVAKDVVVIDTGNYYPKQRDGRIEAIEAGTPESVWVQQRLGHPVVKVFNNIYFEHLRNSGKPRGTPGRIALPVAGDDENAKAVVLGLVDQLGFDGVDAGSLAESWRQEPDSPVYGTDLDAAGVRRALREAVPERKLAFRG